MSLQLEMGACQVTQNKLIHFFVQPLLFFSFLLSRMHTMICDFLKHSLLLGMCVCAFFCSFKVLYPLLGQLQIEILMTLKFLYIFRTNIMVTLLIFKKKKKKGKKFSSQYKKYPWSKLFERKSFYHRCCNFAYILPCVGYVSFWDNILVEFFFLVGFFGGIFWWNFLVEFFGGIFWCNFLVECFGGIFWWNFLV